MIRPIPIVLVVEDILSEALMRRMLRHFPGKFQLRATLGKEGFGFIQKNMPAFNQAAATTGFVVLTDLDNQISPQALLQSWFSEPLHSNLIFQVAIREAEAWVFAHREALAEYLEVPIDAIPSDSETVVDPKKFVIELARESDSEEIREAIVPGPGRRRKVGPDYNGCLLRFVYRKWEPEEARKRSKSLHRALLTLERYVFYPPEEDAVASGIAEHDSPEGLSPFKRN